MTLRRTLHLLAGGLLALLTVTACAERTTTSQNYSAIEPNARVEPPATQPGKSPIEGRYAVNGKASDRVIITRVRGDEYRVEAPGFWEGIGFFDGKVYLGVFRYPEDSKHGSLTKAAGTHRATLQSDGSFKVRGSFHGDGSGDFEVTWKKL